MNLSVGIVGLPNVGKSTLFNALLKKQQALAANYPFATIEPNIGIVGVPDDRLKTLADIIERDSSATPQNDIKRKPPIVPAVVKFVDIAGLVKGASEGAGLGNKFLSHIREVSIIAHVVRAFTDENVIKEGSVDPKTDYQTIQTELMLADLSTIIKIKDVKPKVPVKGLKEAATKIYQGLNQGISARDIKLTDEEKDAADTLCLLSAKPEIVVLNVAEEALNNAEHDIGPFAKLRASYAELLGVSSQKLVVISAQIESELAVLSAEEQKEYLENLGLKESGLERLIKKAYQELNLISFLTAGEKEVRAWTIEKGTNAQNAAGVIHTDFIKNFIKAEVVKFSDFIECQGWKGSREKGKARMEGRDYLIQDGDVVEFKIGK